MSNVISQEHSAQVPQSSSIHGRVPVRTKLVSCTQKDVDAILARLRSVRDGRRRS